MPKLPSNLVKPIPAAFDNPLRRTTKEPSNIPSVPEEAAMARVISLPVPTTGPTSETPTEAELVNAPLNARISVRLDDVAFVALQTECYERRVRGEKTNVAEVAREVLGRWAQRRASSKH